MKADITDILKDAQKAPSVLNSQPWRFRVCGNTIEIYLDKKKELLSVDPYGRLQMASCGTLITHLTHALRRKHWQYKLTYFPRFEETDLIAFVELGGKSDTSGQDHRYSTSSTDAGFLDFERANTGQEYLEQLEKDLLSIASHTEIELLIQDEDQNRTFETYFLSNCAKRLENDHFKNSLNLFFRSVNTDQETTFEDEVLLSDRFFELSHETFSRAGFPETLKDRYYILHSKTDNRYNWLRSGEVIGDIMIHIRNSSQIGMIALPIISSDCCRKWLKKELALTGYPQFVLKLAPFGATEHTQKQPLSNLMKYGL